MGLFSAVKNLLGKLRRQRAEGSLPPLPPKPPAPHQPGFTDILPSGDKGLGRYVEVFEGSEELENFLYFGNWLDVTSSNVKRIRYEADPQRLIVQFKSHGSTYEYTGISTELAHDFAQAVSKGRFVWVHLRSGGVNYRFIGSEDGHVPRRLNIQSMKSHERFLKYLEKRHKMPRFAKVKTRKSLFEVIRKIQKNRAGR